LSVPKRGTNGGSRTEGGKEQLEGDGEVDAWDLIDIRRATFFGAEEKGGELFSLKTLRSSAGVFVGGKNR